MQIVIRRVTLTVYIHDHKMCRIRFHFLSFILFIIIIIIIIIVIIITAPELSLDGSSPYNSTDKTNKNNYAWTK